MEKEKLKKRFDPAGAERMLFARSGVSGVAHLFPQELSSGEATIKVISYEEETIFTLDNMRYIMDGNGFMMMYPGKYVVLKVDGHTVMSDTCMERISNKDFIKAARGKVLIGGLGIGLLLHNILNKPEVTSVTVIEKNPDIIKLVGPRFLHDKLTIIQDDVFTHDANGKKYDCVYMDIWNTISTENLEEMQILATHYRRARKAGSYFDCWLRDYLRKRKRREDRW